MTNKEVPRVIRGKIVSWDRGVGRIINIGKKDCKVIDFIKNKHTSVALKDLTEEATFKTSVVKVKPYVEVLHPETYQSIKIENKADVKPGEHVKIVIWKERAFIV